MKTFFLPVAVISVLAFMHFPAEADDPDSITQARIEKATLEKEINSIESRITATDSLIREEGKRFSLIQQRMRQGIERKKTELDTLKFRTEQLNNDITTLSGQIERVRTGIGAVETQRNHLAAQLVEHCITLEQHIRSSLPWNREQRIARVTALRSDLENHSAQIEEGFSRLIALINEEIEFGNEIVIDTRTIGRNDGSSVNARVLRIGNMWMAYVDMAEERYGVLSRTDDTTFLWNEDLDFTQREALRTAVRVKESKKAPQMVSLPLPAITTPKETQ